MVKLHEECYVAQMKNTDTKTPKKVKGPTPIDPGEHNFGRLSREDRFTTVYIGNMSYEQDEFSLKKLFSTYGKVTYVRLVKDKKTNKSKGIAFVQMPTEKDALYAIERLNGTKLDGRTLKVSVAVENDTIIKTRNGEPTSGPVKKVKGEESPEITEAPRNRRRDKKTGLDLLFENTRS
jgi:RNA recognition motif-containing protein